jgi:16S rRNA (cytidine1402-2'-O)-methyltransferase
LSDPGKSLIQLCNTANLPYTILPGANALIPAIVGAGFDTSIFTFLGFLPQKKGRQTALKEAILRDHPTFFYESVHRIEKLIAELREL